MSGPHPWRSAEAECPNWSHSHCDSASATALPAVNIGWKPPAVAGTKGDAGAVARSVAPCVLRRRGEPDSGLELYQAASAVPRYGAGED